MERFFYETIENWQDWGRVFQRISAFQGLIEEIYRREGLPQKEPQPLTPGTNAVFQVGNTVVKVFFPKEAGPDPLRDFQNETAMCRHLEQLSVPTPKVIAKGVVDDKYRFYYIVTEYFRGKEAGSWLAAASPSEKLWFTRRLRDILKRMNRSCEHLFPETDLLAQALRNPRLQALPPSLRKDLKDRARTVDLSGKVPVHGDLTGENILIGENGFFTIIDCADALQAPAWYEYGPLVFELFQCDPALVRAFGEDDPEYFVERVLDALSLHRFGADLLLETARRQGIPVFSKLCQVKDFLLR